MSFLVEPYACSQNIQGTYSIMVQIFICQADSELLNESNETKNIRWMPLLELKTLLESNVVSFYPMHVDTLRKYMNDKVIK